MWGSNQCHSGWIWFYYSIRSTVCALWRWSSEVYMWRGLKKKKLKNKLLKKKKQTAVFIIVDVNIMFCSFFIVFVFFILMCFFLLTYCGCFFFSSKHLWFFSWGWWRCVCVKSRLWILSCCSDTPCMEEISWPPLHL